jgi:hypothetical protein
VESEIRDDPGAELHGRGGAQGVRTGTGQSAFTRSLRNQTSDLGS